MSIASDYAHKLTLQMFDFYELFRDELKFG